MSNESPLRISSIALLAACILGGILVVSLLLPKVAPATASRLGLNGDSGISAANQSLQVTLSEFRKRDETSTARRNVSSTPSAARNTAPQSTTADLLRRSPQRITAISHKTNASTTVSRNVTEWVPHNNAVPQFYAPVTVHPVTVNIDNSGIMKEISRVHERLDSLAKTANANASTGVSTSSATKPSEDRIAIATTVIQPTIDNSNQTSAIQIESSNHITTDAKPVGINESASEISPKPTSQPEQMSEEVDFGVLDFAAVNLDESNDVAVQETVAIDAAVPDVRSVVTESSPPTPGEFADFSLGAIGSKPSESDTATVRTDNNIPAARTEGRIPGARIESDISAVLSTEKHLMHSSEGPSAQAYDRLRHDAKPVPQVEFQAEFQKQAELDRLPELHQPAGRSETIGRLPSPQTLKEDKPMAIAKEPADFIPQWDEIPSAPAQIEPVPEQSNVTPPLTPPLSPNPVAKSTSLTEVNWSLVPNYDGAKRTTDPPFLYGRQFHRLPAPQEQFAQTSQFGRVQQASYTTSALPELKEEFCQDCESRRSSQEPSQSTPELSEPCPHCYKSHASPASRFADKVGKFFNRLK